MNETKPLQIKVALPLYDALKRLAAEQGTTVKAVVTGVLYRDSGIQKQLGRTK